MDTLQEEISRFARHVNGFVGVSARHIETGRAVGLNAGSSFPMASAFKIPIAVTVLSLVDQGELALDQMVDVGRQDLCPGSGMIRSILFHPGLILSIYNLLELMLVISDNTACDVLLRVAHSPQAVTDFLHREQIDGIRVDRTTRQMVMDKYGVTGVPGGDDWNIECFDQVFDSMPEEEIHAAARRFAEDERDTMTPAGMVDLLEAVFTGRILSAGSRTVLLDIMLRCQTGQGAIKGMLPPDKPVAHKTGTLAEVAANDAGIITLPGEAGHIAVAVSIKSREAFAEASSACQQTIAHIARAIYDFFLYIR